MNVNRAARAGALAVIGALTLAGCAANEASADGPATGSPSAAHASLTGTLNGIGSSAQAVAQQTWIAGMQQANPGLTVNYDPQGSGAGRKSFISGAAEFAGSDVALSDTELAGSFALCKPGTKAIDLPVYISPIAIAYNVDGVKNLKLDAASIAKIFSGKITSWSDPALRALNPGTSLPSAPITVVHRSDDSGTTQNVTEYLAANAPSVWTAKPSMAFPYTVGDAAKGTSGVATAVKNAKNSITYIDESGAAGLSVAQLKVGSTFHTISAAGAAAVVAASPQAPGREPGDLAVAIDRTDTTANAWPLVLVSYVIACRQYRDPGTADLVRAYATHIAGDPAQKAAAAQAGSAPLSRALSAKVIAAADGIR